MVPNETLAPGIDVSNYQGAVDWPTVASSGIAFAYAKATEGTGFVDGTFAANWAGMETAGIARGAYHYFRPREDPQAQAALFAQTVGPLAPGDLPPALDVEATDGITGPALADRILSMLVAVEAELKVRPIIYTSPGFWNAYVRDASGSWPAWTPSYYLWVANYTSAPLPYIPNGWSLWVFWQYSGDGRVPGVSTPVDLDRFGGTLDELRWWLRLPNVTNQKMIDAFATVFGDRYWEAIEQAGLSWMAIPQSSRALVYAGPPIANLPVLSAEDKLRLADALQSSAPATQAAQRALPAGAPPRPVTNSVVRHAFYVVFRQRYVDMLHKTGLADRLLPRRYAGLPYAGPPIEGLPGLTEAQRRRLLAAIAADSALGPTQ
ncbi:MAG: glycoside hydrolase family 25 protein [Anaerolineae bacterium]